ncbi:CBS domain-containing protein [Methanotorris igneus]|uniref:Putative signal transduction protein with CBS domains n=1 Tax=Methanotorris igneus (strain DSM 5666 / JCM 11834 / Kol 5) TaxID=880724 RepID=F6BBF5_METIK|nr:CBS domain-containing protein [Methanotorris igneus]AEF97162.1 putative signal transduction protein with CBS domains [Methanotorris igneus Kol 5]
MKVKELMDTNFLKVYPDYTVEEVAKLMHEKNRYSAPVVDEHDKLVGWVNAIDLLILNDEDKKKEIKEFMHDVDKVIVLNENDEAREAVIKIVKYKVVSIPVVNNEGKVVGIVRNCDITKTLAKLYDIPVYKLFKTLQEQLRGITWEELMEAAAIVTKQTTGEEITPEEYERRIKNATFGKAIWACGGLEKFFAGLIRIGEVALARKVAKKRGM